MKKIVVLIAMFAGISAHALPAAVQNAIAKAKSQDVRTVVTKATGNTPCELDYNVAIQIKSAAYDRLKGQVIYTWETVKNISIDKDGKVMEVCAE